MGKIGPTKKRKWPTAWHGEKMAQDGEKIENGPKFHFLAIFDLFSSCFGLWASLINSFRLSGRFPFYARPPDSQEIGLFKLSVFSGYCLCLCCLLILLLGTLFLLFMFAIFCVSVSSIVCFFFSLSLYMSNIFLMCCCCCCCWCLCLCLCFFLSVSLFMCFVCLSSKVTLMSAIFCFVGSKHLSLSLLVFFLCGWP